LKKGGFDMNLSRYPPIHSAILYCSIESLDILLKNQRIDVNRESIYGQTPLLMLFNRREFGYWQILKMLLERKDLDINYKSSLGQTALSLAIERGYNEAVGLLRAHGAIETELV
jgi:ankyrin repeat protein